MSAVQGGYVAAKCSQGGRLRAVGSSAKLLIQVKAPSRICCVNPTELETDIQRAL